MKHYFLEEDLVVLERDLKELQEKIKELGRKQGEAAGQSTENFGHDDACQEVIHDERVITISRIKVLCEVILNSVVVKPEKFSEKVCLGSTVELSDGRIFRVGSHMVLADHQIKNISYSSPLGKALLGKEKDDAVDFRGKHFTIKNIS